MDETITIMLDGSGGARRYTPKTATQPPAPEGGFLWIHHIGPASDELRNWLTTLGGDAIITAALMAEETRPRCTLHQAGVLINLRGVNLNPGEDPEDMISLRIWAGPTRIITITRHELHAVRDLIKHCEKGSGPASPAEMIARIALYLADRTEPVVASLNERIDDLEDMVEAGTETPPRRELAGIRSTSIQLRRYMFPQRDALGALEIEPLPWLQQTQRNALREATERVTHLAEELDAIRDRAQVVHDHIMDMRAETMNRQMLLLSIVTAVFLPLGLITGLLGINVGGIPGADTPYAFWIVCALLIGIGAILLWLFSRLGWLRRR